MKRYTTLATVALLALTFCAHAEEPRKWTVGTELDLMPFLNDGYYASVIAGYDHWRARFVLTEITTPDFVTQSGFEDNDLSVRAYIVDYYFSPGFTGWWVGPGIEEWNGDVTEEDTGERKSYSTTILTLGGGYTFRFSKHFYLNPWAAVHIPIGGDREVEFAKEDFSIDAMYEAPVKIGFNF